MEKAILKYSLYRRTQPTNEIKSTIHLPKGSVIEVEAMVEGRAIDKITTWYKATDGYYYWGGGVEKVEDAFSMLTTAEPAINFPPATFNWKNNFIGLTDNLKQFTGKGVKVAIIDTGVDLQHPDIANNIKDDRDFTQSNTKQIDGVGHGTAIAGIIGGNSKTDKGIIGVAPECTIVPLRVMRNSEAESDLAKNVKEAIQHAININVDVINMSLNLSRVDTSEIEILIKQAADKGIVLIASAGRINELIVRGVTYPGKDPNVISIGSTNLLFEQRIIDNHPQRLDFLAGDHSFWTLSSKDEKYTTVHGSSFCAAFLSGLAALIIAAERASTGMNTPITRSNMVTKITKCAVKRDQLHNDNFFSFINV